MTSHHANDALLAMYAGGNLAEGWSLAVATHLALCPACRVRLAVFECIGGELLDEAGGGEAGTALTPGHDAAWLEQVARIQGQGAGDSPSKAAPQRRSATAKPTVLPHPLLQYVGGDVDSVRWKALGRGAYHFPLNLADGETNARLLRIPAGKPVPEHGHGGRELTVVLEGAFSDGGRLFQRGDIEDANEDLVHQPIATPERDCICLAVTDSPLRFRSWIIRLVQPILGI